MIVGVTWTKTRDKNNILNMYTDIVKTYTYNADELW